MKNLSSTAKVFILGTILIGFGLTVWTLLDLDGGNLGLYLLAALAVVAQVIKVEGPNDKTNYNIAWFVYGFTFIALGVPSALFVILIAHLVEWAWHKYPWFIQSFNIAVYAIVVFLAGLVYTAINPGEAALDWQGASAMVAAFLVFVLGNHLLVGLVIQLARGQSLTESGVLGSFTLFLDFTVLSMGAVTALIWFTNPYAAILNILPMVLLYKALQVPALERQVENLEKNLSESVSNQTPI
jgi:hypothetical protein